MNPYYEDEWVTLYHGDAREVLPSVMDQWTVALTDPPYGVGFSGKSTKWTAPGSGGYSSIADDPSIVAEVAVPVVRTLIADGRTVVVTPGVTHQFRYPEPRNVGAIYYPSGAGSCSWGFVCSQPIFYYGPDPYLAKLMGSRPNSFQSTEAAEVNGHPCPKPIGTMRWLVNRATVEPGVVLDPFAGSGTTLIAARESGHVAIGIELDERYCEIAAKRLAQGVLDFGAVS